MSLSTQQARKILIMTPTKDGMVHGAYMRSVWDACTLPGVTLARHHMWPEDLCRVRARMANLAMQSSYSHLFFWDSDISMSLAMFQALISSPYAFAAGLYMNQRGKYPYHGKAEFDANGWARVERVPLGAACVAVEALRLADAIPFTDVIPETGQRVVTPGLFNLIEDSDGTMLSEDYSFCDRMRELCFPHIYGRETATHWKMVPLRDVAPSSPQAR